MQNHRHSPAQQEMNAGSELQLVLSSKNGYLLVRPESLDDTHGPQIVSYSSSIPRDLNRMLQSLSPAHQRIERISYGPSGEWFLHFYSYYATGDNNHNNNDTADDITMVTTETSSRCRNDDHEAFWDVATTQASQYLEQSFTSDETLLPILVAFGPGLSYCFSSPANGSDGGKILYAGKKFPLALRKRITNLQSLGGHIHALVLFPNGGYFISDSEGGLDVFGAPPALERELRKGGYHNVCSVQLGSDDEWIILRQNSFQTSPGVCMELRNKLQEYYDEAEAMMLEQDEDADAEARQSERDRASELEREMEEKRAAEEKEHVRLLQLEHEQQVRAEQDQRIAQQQQLAQQQQQKQREQQQLEHQRRIQEEQERHRLFQLEQQEIKLRAEQERIRAQVEAERKNSSKKKGIELKKNMVQRIGKARSKGLRVGEVVTVLGFSDDLGDCTIESVNEDCSMLVAKNEESDSILVEDLRRIALYRLDDEVPSEIIKLVKAKDKYTAAVVGLNCHRCNSSMCFCKRDWMSNSTGITNMLRLASMNDHLSSSTIETVLDDPNGGTDLSDTNQSDQSSPNSARSRSNHRDVLDEHSGSLCNADEMPHETVMRLLHRPEPIDRHRVEFAPIMEQEGEELLFDEFRCAEKIDFGNLDRVRKVLETDKSIRKETMESLSMLNDRKKQSSLGSAFLSKLERCYEFEMVIEELYNLMKEYPKSRENYVVHMVEYQQRDPFHRGRQFALGQRVSPFDNQYPRNTTLQSMQPDWLAALCGAFGHCIEMENSHIGILCSIADQMGMGPMIPIIRDFRDNAMDWVRTFSKLHKISEDSARKWPNVVVAGGHLVYRSWLESAGIEESNEDPVIKLAIEVSILAEEILTHPKYRWATVDRIKLVSEGRTPCNIQSIMLNRVVQSCENELLTIQQRCLQSAGWTTRAKMFDSLIVEARAESSASLQSVIKLCEASCRAQDFKVRLVERDMHGMHELPIKTIVDARLALIELSKAQKRVARKQISETWQLTG